MNQAYYLIKSNSELSTLVREAVESNSETADAVLTQVRYKYPVLRFIKPYAFEFPLGFEPDHNLEPLEGVGGNFFEFKKNMAYTLELSEMFPFRSIVKEVLEEYFEVDLKGKPVPFTIGLFAEENEWYLIWQKSDVGMPVRLLDNLKEVTINYIMRGLNQSHII